MLKNLVLLTLVLALSACGGMRAQKLVGLPAQEVFASYGPPSQIVEDGESGKIWIYTSTDVSYSASLPVAQPQPTQSDGGFWDNVAKGAQDAAARTAHGSATTTTRHRMFWVNATGIVTRTSLAVN